MTKKSWKELRNIRWHYGNANNEEGKKSLIQTVETVIDEYRNDIDLSLIGFPENYLEIMKNNL